MLKITKIIWKPFEHKSIKNIYINKKLIDSIEENGNQYTINMQNGFSYYNVKIIEEVKFKKII